MSRSSILLALAIGWSGCCKDSRTTIFQPTGNPPQESEGGEVRVLGGEVDPEALDPGDDAEVTLIVDGNEADDDKTVPVEIDLTWVDPTTFPPTTSAPSVFAAGDQEVDLNPIGVWTGTLPQGGEALFMMFDDGLIEGNVQVGEYEYVLRTNTESSGVLEVVDPDLLSDHGDEVSSAETDDGGDGTTGAHSCKDPEDGAPAGAHSCKDPEDVIDVMVLYTKEAACHAAAVFAVLPMSSGDEPAGMESDSTLCDPLPEVIDTRPIKHQIAFAVGKANLAFSRSGVAARLNLVYVGEAEGIDERRYVAACDEDPDSPQCDGEYLHARLSDELTASDPSLPILLRRSDLHADLVVLVYEHTAPESVAGGPDCGTSSGPFSVSRRICSGLRLTLAHEVAHTLGAGHDRSLGPHDPPPADGRCDTGHIRFFPSVEVSAWRTVMAQSGACREEGIICHRVPWFSNPDVRYPHRPPSDGVDVSGGTEEASEGDYGDPTGVPESDPGASHNVKVINRNAPEVSRYVCSVTGDEADVWMKDYWLDVGTPDQPDADDTGSTTSPAGTAEPEPDVSVSPDIWVRRQQDADSNGNRQHEHQHEEPVEGQVSFVYVKVRNSGGKDAKGWLQLYASPGGDAVNPNKASGWGSPVGAEQAVVPSGGLHVFMFPWTKGSDAGEWGLLARWSPSNMPLTLSGGSLEASVREDRHLAWLSRELLDLWDSVPVGTLESSLDFQEVVHSVAGEKTFLQIDTQLAGAREVDWEKLVIAKVVVDPGTFAKIKVREGVSNNGQANQRHFAVKLDESTKVIGPFDFGPDGVGGIDLRFDPVDDKVKELSSRLTRPLYYDITVTRLVVPGHIPDTAASVLRNGVVKGRKTYTLRIPKSGP